MLPRLAEAAQGPRKVFFVEAAHFVMGAFLGMASSATPLTTAWPRCRGSACLKSKPSPPSTSNSSLLTKPHDARYRSPTCESPDLWKPPCRLFAAFPSGPMFERATRLSRRPHVARFSATPLQPRAPARCLRKLNPCRAVTASTWKLRSRNSASRQSSSQPSNPSDSKNPRPFKPAPSRWRLLDGTSSVSHKPVPARRWPSDCPPFKKSIPTGPASKL